MFFTSVGPEGVAVMTDIRSYLDFVLKLLFCVWHQFSNPDRRGNPDLDGHDRTGPAG